jgi:transcriptional regulator
MPAANTFCLTNEPNRSKLSILDMSNVQNEVPYGTLDLLILKTLDSMGTMHGYAIARRIEQVSGDALQLSQGSIYPALIRLQQEGWISTEWGISETNRKVKFYSLTKAGRKQLLVEIENWEKSMAFVARFLEASS